MNIANGESGGINLLSITATAHIKLFDVAILDWLWPGTSNIWEFSGYDAAQNVSILTILIERNLWLAIIAALVDIPVCENNIKYEFELLKARSKTSTNNNRLSCVVYIDISRAAQGMHLIVQFPL